MHQFDDCKVDRDSRESEWEEHHCASIWRHNSENEIETHLLEPKTFTDFSLHFLPWQTLYFHHLMLEKHICISYYEFSNTSKWISVLFFTGTGTWAVPVLNKQPILGRRMDLLSLCDTAVACGWGAQEENAVWFLHCKRKLEKWKQGTLNQRKGKYRAAFISPKAALWSLVFQESPAATCQDMHTLWTLGGWFCVYQVHNKIKQGSPFNYFLILNILIYGLP